MRVKKTPKDADLIIQLKELLQNNKIKNQEEIKRALIEKNLVINQSKISRLLRKIGAIKITDEMGQIIYTLPQEPLPTSQGQLSQLILGIYRNESLIVVRTNPGSAPLIGRVIDHHAKKLEILGCVAGDDTLFVAPSSVKSIPKILHDIKELLATMG